MKLPKPASRNPFQERISQLNNIKREPMVRLQKLVLPGFDPTKECPV